MARQKIFVNVGQVFGRLTVIGNIDTQQIKVRCECGTIKLVRKYNLFRGEASTRSCGCLFKDMVIARNKKSKGIPVLPFPDCAVARIIRSYKNGARYRKLEFSISDAKVKELIQKPCYYCKEDKTLSTTTDIYSYLHNGIDRVDNNQGYILGNVVPCCKFCNRAKGTYSDKEFIDFCRKIAKTHPEESDD